MFNKLFSKKNIIISEKKSVNMNWPWLISGNSGINSNLTIKRALNFYDECAPVATAIDWINDEFKTLTLVLKENDESKDNEEILKFLRTPNDDMVQEDFLETLGAYFLITNEVYILAYGLPNKKPSEIIVLSPEFVTPEKGKDGFIYCMKVRVNGTSEEIFKRTENQYRFFNKDLTAEIWQIKGFSAIGDSTVSSSNSLSLNNISNSRGRSKLSSIHKEINQYLEIATHNLAVLDNGMIPSGSIEMPEDTTLTDEQFERLREQIVNFYSGSKNAGHVLILENGLKFIPAGINAKDMDFEKLARRVEIAVFNRYKVPLPLVSPDNMTLANMESAKLNLYDNCVIPLAQRLLRELTSFLAPRFGLSENALICIDYDDISALQIRRNEELKLKKELDILTKDELRRQIGLDEIEGGNKLYMLNNMIPLGATPCGENDLITVIDSQNEKSVKQSISRKEFITLMQNQIDVKGDRLFNDAEINQFADNEGL